MWVSPHVLFEGKDVPPFSAELMVQHRGEMSATKPRLVDDPVPQAPSPSVQQNAGNEAGLDAVFQLTPESSIADRQFSFVVLLLLTSAAVYVAYLIFRPFLTSLFLALVLTIAFLPMHAWITRRVRSANAAALITEAMVVLFILVPLLLISIKLLSEAASLYNSLSQQQWGAAAWSGHFAWLSDAVQRIAERAGISAEQLRASITARTRTVGMWAVAMVGWAARRILQQISTAVFTLLILFFFLRDREQYSNAVIGVLPLSPARVQQLEAALRVTVVAKVYGMLIVGMLEGVLTALAFWVTGLRAPLLWGAMAAVLSLMPRVGPWLVWVPGVFWLAVQGFWVKAIILFMWCAVVATAAHFVVRDKVEAGRVNISRLLILLSFLGGLQAFGAIGMIAGPVVLALVVTLLTMLREEYGSLRRARKAPA
jgi:predicted PurR-regulated permease PerM